jgi:hypothetical protein
LPTDISEPATVSHARALPDAVHYLMPGLAPGVLGGAAPERFGARAGGCAGARWSLHLGSGGTPGAVWCPWRARASAIPPLLGRAAPERSKEAALAAWQKVKRRHGATSVVLSPREDFMLLPHGDAGRTLALALASDLLAMGVPVAMTTRAGEEGSDDLVTLARRFGALLRVRVGVFGGHPDDERRWEPGLPVRAKRLGLAAALVKAGAAVELEVGPIIPFVNDDPAVWRTILRTARRNGVSSVVPRFVAGNPELAGQITRELGANSARMISGWLAHGPDDPWLAAAHPRRGRRSAGDGNVRTLPFHARQPRRMKLAAAANDARLPLRSCSCFEAGRGHVCHDLPAPAPAPSQLDLFSLVG